MPDHFLVAPSRRNLTFVGTAMCYHSNHGNRRRLGTQSGHASWPKLASSSESLAPRTCPQLGDCPNHWKLWSLQFSNDFWKDRTPQEWRRCFSTESQVTLQSTRTHPSRPKTQEETIELPFLVQTESEGSGDPSYLTTVGERRLKRSRRFRELRIQLPLLSAASTWYVGGQRCQR